MAAAVPRAEDRELLLLPSPPRSLATRDDAVGLSVSPTHDKRLLLEDHTHEEAAHFYDHTREEATPPLYVPRRLLFVLVSLMGTTASYMLRSNLSTAIIPMAAQFQWSKSDQGSILSA